MPPVSTFISVFAEKVNQARRRFWRMWQAWRVSGVNHSWIATAGVAESMAVGAVVLAYYLIYSAGVRWRLRQT